ncbi:unnamed protein product [Cylicostephanus goldi]|uniref:ABC transmembrane type-1 domain-containing protein n=1 Tax=Cylicostephanus goldi TaxID=71465 RepID=A0A3P6SJZ7_CYLGO|nr:unnamed protein product [Cylicostephanus goldi]
MYLNAFSYAWAFIFLALLTSRYAMQAASGIYLSHWADANSKLSDSADTITGLLIYVALGFGTVLLNVITFTSSTFGGVRASIVLHKPLVESLMHAPLSFFEETPLGRILSRLAGDIDIIDTSLPINLRLVVDTLAHVSSKILGLFWFGV